MSIPRPSVTTGASIPPAADADLKGPHHSQQRHMQGMPHGKELSMPQFASVTSSMYHVPPISTGGGPGMADAFPPGPSAFGPQPGHPIASASPFARAALQGPGVCAPPSPFAGQDPFASAGPEGTASESQSLMARGPSRSLPANLGIGGGPSAPPVPLHAASNSMQAFPREALRTHTQALRAGHSGPGALIHHAAGLLATSMAVGPEVAELGPGAVGASPRACDTAAYGAALWGDKSSRFAGNVLQRAGGPNVVLTMARPSTAAATVPLDTSLASHMSHQATPTGSAGTRTAASSTFAGHSSGAAQGEHGDDSADGDSNDSDSDTAVTGSEDGDGPASPGGGKWSDGGGAGPGRSRRASVDGSGAGNGSELLEKADSCERRSQPRRAAKAGGLCARAAGVDKKLGGMRRPLLCEQDPDAPGLSLEQSRKIRRRINNRASARRVRAKREHDLKDYTAKVAALDAEREALLARASESQATCMAAAQQLKAARERWQATCLTNAALCRELGELRRRLDALQGVGSAVPAGAGSAKAAKPEEMPPGASAPPPHAPPPASGPTQTGAPLVNPMSVTDSLDLNAILETGL